MIEKERRKKAPINSTGSKVSSQWILDILQIGNNRYNNEYLNNIILR